MYIEKYMHLCGQIYVPSFILEENHMRWWGQKKKTKIKRRNGEQWAWKNYVQWTLTWLWFLSFSTTLKEQKTVKTISPTDQVTKTNHKIKLDNTKDSEWGWQKLGAEQIPSFFTNTLSHYT